MSTDISERPSLESNQGSSSSVRDTEKVSEVDGFQDIEVLVYNVSHIDVIFGLQNHSAQLQSSKKNDCDLTSDCIFAKPKFSAFMPVTRFVYNCLHKFANKTETGGKLKAMQKTEGRAGGKREGGKPRDVTTAALASSSSSSVPQASSPQIPLVSHLSEAPASHMHPVGFDVRGITPVLPPSISAGFYVKYHPGQQRLRLPDGQDLSRQKQSRAALDPLATSPTLEGAARDLDLITGVVRTNGRERVTSDVDIGLSSSSSAASAVSSSTTPVANPALLAPVSVKPPIKTSSIRLVATTGKGDDDGDGGGTVAMINSGGLEKHDHAADLMVSTVYFPAISLLLPMWLRFREQEMEDNYVGGWGKGDKEGKRGVRKEGRRRVLYLISGSGFARKARHVRRVGPEHRNSTQCAADLIELFVRRAFPGVVRANDYLFLLSLPLSFFLSFFSLSLSLFSRSYPRSLFVLSPPPPLSLVFTSPLFPFLCVHLFGFLYCLSVAIIITSSYPSSKSYHPPRMW